MHDTFSEYHPLINFLYFGMVLVFSMIFTHPFCLAVSFICAFTYSVNLRGKKGVWINLAYMLPIMIITAALNPAFNHEGVTILTYLPSGNPLTLESIVYGAAAAAMLAEVICWFTCYNAVMSSDKFVYLFGRVIPALSLVLSMTLRFVPKFRSQMKTVSNAQKCVGRDSSNGGILMRIKHGLTILSIMVTWSLENAIETADSMRSRGYGLPGRTAFSIYKFDRRDFEALMFLVLCGAYVIIGGCTDALKWRYFPSIKGNSGAYTWSVTVVYFALCIMPVVINLAEDRKWKSLRSAI